MTRDEIISMARQAGVFESIPLPQLVPLERFAKLVIADFLERTGQYVTNDASREAAIAEAVAAEREACADLAEEISDAHDRGDNGGPAIVRAIRARGAE